MEPLSTEALCPLEAVETLVSVWNLSKPFVTRMPPHLPSYLDTSLFLFSIFASWTPTISCLLLVTELVDLSLIKRLRQKNYWSPAPCGCVYTRMPTRL